MPLRQKQKKVKTYQLSQWRHVLAKDTPYGGQEYLIDSWKGGRYDLNPCSCLTTGYSWLDKASAESFRTRSGLKDQDELTIVQVLFERGENSEWDVSKILSIS